MSPLKLLIVSVAALLLYIAVCFLILFCWQALKPGEKTKSSVTPADEDGGVVYEMITKHRDDMSPTYLIQRIENGGMLTSDIAEVYEINHANLIVELLNEHAELTQY